MSTKEIAIETKSQGWRTPIDNRYTNGTMGKGKFEWGKTFKDNHHFCYSVTLDSEANIKEMINFTDDLIKSNGIPEFLRKHFSSTRVYTALIKSPEKSELDFYIKAEFNGNSIWGPLMDNIDTPVFNEVVDIACRIEDKYFPEYKALRK